MSITEKQLTDIQARLAAATDGPWAAWADQDGQPHMQGRLMVGVAAGVIPDGDTWIEGPDVNNPIAETYTPEDRVFIAHAREDIPALLAEVERLRDELAKVREVTEEKVDRAKFAFGAATAVTSSIPIGMSEHTFIQGVSIQHGYAVRIALHAALGGGDDA